MPNGCGVRWAECLLIIGTGCRVQVFSLILDSSVGLSAGIQSAGDWVSETLWVRILHSAEEDNLSPFDSKIACLCQSIEINNNKYVDVFTLMSSLQGPILYIVQDPKLVIISPVDVVAPDSARSSAGTLSTCFLQIFSGYQCHHFTMVDQMMSVKMADEILCYLVAPQGSALPYIDILNGCDT